MLPEPVVQITVTEEPVALTVVSADAPAPVAYHHVQGLSSTEWVIRHNLGWYPNVTTLDSAGSVSHGELVHDSKNQLRVTFSAPISGNAYLS